MKVILLEDVKALGKKGELVTISDGYARNYILKKKLGKEATSRNLNELKLQKAHQDKKAQEQLEAAKVLAGELEEKEVLCRMKVGEGGRTFGSLSTKEIVQAAKEQLGLELDKKKMALDEPIKALGVHQVKLKLHPQVTGTLKVKVVEQ